MSEQEHDIESIIHILEPELQRRRIARVVARYRGPHHVLGAAAVGSTVLLTAMLAIGAPLAVMIGAVLVLVVLETACCVTYLRALQRDGLEHLGAWTVTITHLLEPAARPAVLPAAGSSAGREPEICNCDRCGCDCGP